MAYVDMAYSHGLYSYGLYSYGLYRYDLYIMAYISWYGFHGMVFLVMAYTSIEKKGSALRRIDPVHLPEPV